MTVPGIHEETGIDPWFLAQVEELVHIEQRWPGARFRRCRRRTFGLLKPRGSPTAAGELLGAKPAEVRVQRLQLGVRRYTSGSTPALPSSPPPARISTRPYEEEWQAAPTGRKKIMVLGGGPNRIGQGIEFDYCCVHAALALREDGFETIMVNCNPETVSTDYDTSDRLYFEPVTLRTCCRSSRWRSRSG